MSTSIGVLSPTQIPSLSESADIQEAFRLYHYGAPSGVGVGEYDPTNSNPASLTTPSIAQTLWSLQNQITTVSGSLGIQTTVFTAKGDIIAATSSAVVVRLGVGTDGFILTANSASATGLVWAVPTVTPTNSVALTNKTITSGIITSPALSLSTASSIVDSRISWDTTNKRILVGNGAAALDISPDSVTATLLGKTLSAPTVINDLYLGQNSRVVFEGTTDDAFEIILTVIDPTVDRTISLPNVSGTVLTTGNLSDITSVGILSSLYVTGSAVSHMEFVLKSSSYTLITADDGRTVEMSNGGTITVPEDGGAFIVPIGTDVYILQTGASQVTIAAGAGVTVNGTPGLKLRAQWAGCVLTKRAANLWVVSGDLVA